MAVDYPIIPIPFTQVTIADQFWWPRIETNRAVTIPYDFQKCEETNRIRNFEIAAGQVEGEHEGIYFNDSDVFKVVEGAAYALEVHPDPELERYIDGIIEKIEAAQEEDGYLYTIRTINPEKVHEHSGPSRWSNLAQGHELYNMGHLYEAAVAYYQATGKRKLLDVSLKNADLIDSVFGPAKIHDVPGHQEIEIGLVKLYRTTGEQRYLNLAKFFLDQRGHPEGRVLYKAFEQPGYMQDHLPVVEQDEAVGHAVRAGYMYSGMADVAALTGDEDYVRAIKRIWDNVVSKKLYLTGGIGALHRGEAFGAAYELPNATAYNETCAAIANVMWNHRLFLLTGESKYIDVLERTLYNGFLAGIALSGNEFFYPNPLEADGEYAFNKGETSRSPWFDCSCCPTNVVRLLPSLPGYMYAVRDDSVYVNLFSSSHVTIAVKDVKVSITQQTDYPWQGAVRIIVQPEEALEFTMNIRIPGWAQNSPVPSDLYRYINHTQQSAIFAVNGETVEWTIESGYAHIKRVWQSADIIDLQLPMPVRRVIAHEHVEDDAGKVAIERGPIVYCAEWVDNGGRVSDMVLPDDLPLEAEHHQGLFDGVTIIHGTIAGREITLIPYYAWAHRGAGEMAVWLPRQ